jgi:hypothetical protein
METTKYRLSRHAFLCVANRYCVVLDAKSERYRAVKRDEVESLGPWLEGWPGSVACNDPHALPPQSAGEVAAELCRREILTTVDREGKPVQPQRILPATKNTAALERPAAAALLRQGAKFLFAVARTRRQFQRGSFETVIHDVEILREPGAADREVDVKYERFLVSIFDGWRSCYSRPYVCLFDSLCLLNFLALHGLFPRLVFGVIVEPFHAHCWLQKGNVVLNDTVERVSAYTPIMCV